jgi:hypothetical protein
VGGEDVKGSNNVTFAGEGVGLRWQAAGTKRPLRRHEKYRNGVNIACAAKRCEYIFGKTIGLRGTEGESGTVPLT